MSARLVLTAALALALAGCGDIPVRKDGFADSPGCLALYNRYDELPSSDRKVPEEVRASPCWKRAKEERDDYDLLFVEFDDQGWVQGSADLPRPAAEDHLDALYRQLRQLYDENLANGLSLVVYVHGWHHNAAADDTDVGEFRKLVRSLASAERGRRAGDKVGAQTGPRVVGIYVGWRGESITIPWLNVLTFWERKNTAERVAQGSVRELFARLDFLRDRGRRNVPWDALSSKDRPGEGKRNVRMLTIGHSFGGLIAFQALNNEFVRAAARSKGEDYVSRLGDLVVIVNPAFEGARYEPLMAAGQRIAGLKKDQLPVVIVATSKADGATRYLFPAARFVSTFLERTPGAEDDAIVYAVGHNARYTTHELALCATDDKACTAACKSPPDVSDEYGLMKAIAGRGFKAEGRDYLCSGLQLQRMRNWKPEGNPFWVVSTTKDLMQDHNDIFNPRFVSFIRQMYLGVIAARFEE